MKIGDHEIGPGNPVYIIAEMSANHGGEFDRAVEILHAMKESGADAVKLQTYTADTLTIECDRDEFKIGGGTLWEGRTLYDLYKEASMPWEWQPKLKEVASDLELDLFSTPYDPTSVDFLEKMDVPAYKVASFELVDLPLIKKIASTRKPIIMSTGMASKEEIEEAIKAAKSEDNEQIALLKCTSAYPAKPEEMNLITMADMEQGFGLPVGLSDHSLDLNVPVSAVALGACIVEKHFTMSRSEPGPDAYFSLEPHEFKQMVEAIRAQENSPMPKEQLDETILGKVSYGTSGQDEKSLQFRRSLFVVQNMNAGEEFSNENVRSIRPANGLPPKEIENVLGKRSKQSIERGTPLNWDLIE